MTNMEVYKKTLPFSLRRLGWDILSLVALAGFSIGGFFIGGAVAEGDRPPIIGLAVGLIIGIVVCIFITRYNGFANKAAQIAMMTRGVTEDSLPDDVIGEGKRIVKSRFSTVAGFYLVTGVIRGVFGELGRGITKLGEAVGGDTGGQVGSAISSVIQTIVRYLCDCCLGWVFYRSETTAPRATLEGAAIFFKHGKTLAKNLGRVFGFGLISLLLIGGAFAGIAYLILNAIVCATGDMSFLEQVSTAFRNADTPNAITQFLSDPHNLVIGAAILTGIILWSIVHSVFGRPYVLVGVLRNFIASGANDIPTEAAFNKLDSMSPKFRKAHAQAN